jgi:hypothetical protein
MTTTTSRSVYARRAAERDARIAEDRERAEFEAFRRGRRPSGPQAPLLVEATSKTIKLWLVLSVFVLVGSWTGAYFMLPSPAAGATAGIGLVAFVVIQIVARVTRWWRHG